jgi:methionine aminopeptidase
MQVLPVGLTAEPNVLVTLLRVVALLWAATLLLAGRRLARTTVGTLLLLVGAAVGWGALASTSYLLAIVAAVAVLAVGIAAFEVAPRVVMTLATAWPLPAAYLAVVLLQGDFPRRRWLLLVLLVVGAALGALLPEPSVGIVASALGVALLALAWPGEPRPWLLGVLVVAVAWNLVGLRRPLALRGRFPEPAGGRRDVRTPVRRSLVVGAGGLLGFFLLAALVAPQPAAAGAEQAAHLQAVRARAGLSRPGFVTGSANGFYLFGRPLPVALAGPGGGLTQRLAVLAVGASPTRAVAAARTVKTAEELARMRRAAAITATAFDAIRPLVRPGTNEREIDAAITAAYVVGGATGRAFASVVGSGPNAVRPHYMANDAELREGLVVVDIGCSVDGYASDMTRTFPVRGTFSESERTLVDVVLEAKEEARKALRPGVTMRELNKLAKDVIDKAGFGPFFIHGLGHHVGIDVHDPGARGPLEAGMVVTLEPGIYVPAGAAVDRAYWNLGVRIEDTYVVTADGCEPLVEYPQLPVAGTATR